MRYLLFFIVSVHLFAGPALGSEAADVKALLKSNVDAVVTLLQDADMDKGKRNQQILKIITPVFDFETMAKLSLGKKYWPTLSEAQQSEFSDLFIHRLQESYLDKLDIYTDEKVVYGAPLAQGTKIHVPTTLVAKDSNIEMLYKFYRSGKDWKIYDVEIGGVSVIQTYRSQFDGVLRQGSIADLFDKLRDEGTFVLPEPGEQGAPPGSD